ncbi:MAG TPA: YqiA/YcfP family alpha/beta fold hydrolase [Vicinamibacterales bacterium]|nr:YqiA/YcfP family alpha/beta fold hydrolase [Vicinamibacterales bacterium]
MTRSGSAPTPVLYLHGFASSPQSTKARYFAERLAAHGVALAAPDFNQPDFTSLTMSRMLDQLDAEIDAVGGRATLMGSSLGAALAVLAAGRFADAVDRLVLLAPAVMFAKPGHSLLPPERIEEWRHRGSLPFFHYAYGEERALQYEFYADSLQHDAFEVAFTQPTLIFQGLGDTVVDPRTVELFARTRPNVTLSLLDDDHQLAASLPRMWASVEDFLGLLD